MIIGSMEIAKKVLALHARPVARARRSYDGYDNLCVAPVDEML